jgi:hypothetical protein
MNAVTKRQEANFKIAEIIKSTEPKLGTVFLELAKKHPLQRAGQIVCNYIFPDYRDADRTPYVESMMKKFFDIDFDPFYEESDETLKRLTGS